MADQSYESVFMPTLAKYPVKEDENKWGYATEFATRQMRICLGGHEECQRFDRFRAPFLPTRLIDVGPSANGSIKPRLVVTSDSTIRKMSNLTINTKYIALSYCWGKTQNFVTTTKNIECLKKGIIWSDLPLTIQDAIEVTRELNIRYLWVDALCIMQDSLDDWNAEAINMARVYGNAFVTIAAALSPDVHHGLSIKKQVDGRWEYLEDNPLYSRAWALQERILSPRVLIFESMDISWECQNQAGAAEIGMETISLKGMGLRASMGQSWRLPPKPTSEDWYRIVGDYTFREMTKSSDKLPALSGLATVYGQATGWTYIMGLWKEILIYDLLWWQDSDFDFQNRVPAQYRAPSWSWASLTGHVSWIRALSDDLSHMSARVVKTFLDSDDIIMNDISTSTTGWICLTGSSVKTSIENGELELEHTKTWLDYREFDAQTRNWVRPHNFSSVLCLVCYQSRYSQRHPSFPETEVLNHMGLILKKLEDGTQSEVYKRIGRYDTSCELSKLVVRDFLKTFKEATVYII